jgi:hypothetical protein
MYVEFEVANFWRCIYNIDVCCDFFSDFLNMFCLCKKIILIDPI